MGPLEYDTCPQCGKLFFVPEREVWRYKARYNEKYIYLHTWSCQRAWEKEHPPKKQSIWYDF